MIIKQKILLSTLLGLLCFTPVVITGCDNETNTNEEDNESYTYQSYTTPKPTLKPTPEPTPRWTMPVYEYKPSKEALYAIGLAKEAVLNELDTPATAIFPDDEEFGLCPIELKENMIIDEAINYDKVYNIWSYVDHQNLAGALVRDKFWIEVCWNKDSKRFIYSISWNENAFATK